ncbi:MAG TPA: DoxX family membrane protein [Candidatus Paceibacterota bacterium]
MLGISFIVGHVIVGLYFLINAYSHLFKSSDMVGYAASKKVPSPRLAIIVSGLLLLVAGLSFVSGMYMFYGIIAALVFMIPVTIMMHNFWAETDPMAKMNQRISFLKNVAIIGFLLMLL